MVFVYGDEGGDMKVLSFLGSSGIMALWVPSTFAFLKAVKLEVQQAMPLLNTIHFATDPPCSQYRNRSICSLVRRFPPYSVAGGQPRPGTTRQCRRVITEDNRQPG